MTSLWLGTGQGVIAVYSIAKELGFRPRRVPGCCAVDHWHQSVDDLRLQIACNRGFFPELADIIAATIEFDDFIGCSPHNRPEAVEILKQMYAKIPDLVYTRPALEDFLKPARPLSDYFLELEKKEK